MKTVAAAAGMGAVTVGRVPNGRGNVSPKTAERISIAARRPAGRAPPGPSQIAGLTAYLLTEISQSRNISASRERRLA
nr:LacI family DNA-binding transcriptional regulator [Rhizobium lusitanum]